MNPATFAALPASASACVSVTTPGTFGPDRITTNAYDIADRLIQVQPGDGASRLRTLAHDLTATTSDVTWTFGYNPASQVFTRQTSNAAYLYAPAAGAQAITRNGLNQPTVVNGVSATSDARGNLTFDGVKSFTFDSANRLTGTGSSTLAHDPLDRMTQMTGTLGARYLYDRAETAGLAARGRPGSAAWGGRG